MKRMLSWMTYKGPWIRESDVVQLPSLYPVRLDCSAPIV